MTRRYNCHTCSEPMQISAWLQAKLVADPGAAQFNQSCPMCGAVHMVMSNSVTLTRPGANIAKLTEWYDADVYEPYRVGPYRVMFQTGEIARSYWEWNGTGWVNGPMTLSVGSVRCWQGLAGDMEHLKTLPYAHDLPLSVAPDAGD